MVRRTYKTWRRNSQYSTGPTPSPSLGKNTLTLASRRYWTPNRLASPGRAMRARVVTPWIDSDTIKSGFLDSELSSYSRACGSACGDGNRFGEYPSAANVSRDIIEYGKLVSSMKLVATAVLLCIKLAPNEDCRACSNPSA